MAENRKPFANMLNGAALFTFGCRAWADDSGEVFNVASSRGITKSIWEITLKAVFARAHQTAPQSTPNGRSQSLLFAVASKCFVCDMFRSFLGRVHQHNPNTTLVRH